MTHAYRQISREPTSAPPRRAPPNEAASAAIIPLAAAPAGRAPKSAGRTGAAPNPPSGRRGSRGSDLIFGGALALILLIACLTWEVLSDGNETPHVDLQGGQSASVPALR